MCLLPVLALRVEVVHCLAQQVGLVGICKAGARVLHLLRVVAVQLLHIRGSCVSRLGNKWVEQPTTQMLKADSCSCSTQQSCIARFGPTLSTHCPLLACRATLHLTSQSRTTLRQATAAEAMPLNPGADSLCQHLCQQGCTVQQSKPCQTSVPVVVESYGQAATRPQPSSAFGLRVVYACARTLLAGVRHGCGCTTEGSRRSCHASMDPLD